MRRNRLIALGLLLLSLIAISFCGGPVSYGFFFFMLVAPVISVIYTLVLFLRFKIYQKIESKVAVAESPVTFYFTLQNEDFFGFAGVKTDFFSDFSTITGLDTDTEYELFPHTGIKKETKLVCKYRGEYEVGVKNVMVTDFLRLFNFNFKNKETISVNVIPQLVILDEIPSLDALSISARDCASNKTEPDVLVREYIPGDDIRSINWKLTAATGKPMVRNRTGENAPGISIIMDSFRYDYDPENYLPLENKLLETTIALTYYYLEHGIRVGVYAYSGGPLLFALEKPDDFEEFYRAMSSFFFDDDNTSDKLFGYAAGSFGIYESSAVIFVVHSLTDEYMKLAKDLEGNSISTATYLVTDEEVTASKVITIGYDDKLKEVL